MAATRRAMKSDLARIDKLRDEDIDYSDIPELDVEDFAQPLVPWPPKKETITIRVDSDVLRWFKRQGRGYETRINQALRRYMEVVAGPRRRKTRARHAAPSLRARDVKVRRNPELRRPQHQPGLR